MRLGLPFTLVFVSSFLALRVWTDGLSEERSDQDCQIPTQSCVQEETFQDISGEEDLDVLASRMSSIGPLLSLLERSSRLENFHVIVIQTRNGTHFLHVLNLINERLRNYQSWKPFFVLHLTYEVAELEVATALTGSKAFLSEINLASYVYLKIGARFYEVYFLEDLVIRQTSSPCTFNVSGRKDLRGARIKGVTQDDPELELIATFDEIQGELRFKSGLSVAYFRLMAFALNFTIGAVRGTGWIQQSSNGSLTGMAEQLKEGTADILIAHSELLPYRLRSLRYLHPYYRGKIRAFFKQPPLSNIRNIFFHPFQPQVWGCLLLSWGVITLFLKVTFATRQRLRRTQEGDFALGGNALLWALSTASGQGWHSTPNCGSMKLLMFTGLVNYIFSYTAYSAAVITSLAIYMIPIKSWGELKVGAGYQIFGDVKLQYSQQVAAATLNVSDAIALMSKNRPVAVVSVFDQFYQIAKKAGYGPAFLCKNVAKVNVEGQVVKGGMIVRKGSPYRKYFNLVTIMIQERGLDARLSRVYLRKWSPGCIETADKARPVNEKYVLQINDVFTAFAILSFAFLSSFAGLVTELWLHQKAFLEDRRRMKAYESREELRVRSLDENVNKNENPEKANLQSVGKNGGRDGINEGERK